MTLQERADVFALTFPTRPASHLHVVLEGRQPVLYGRWLGGQNYRAKTTLYGAYPPGYLDRVMALFPDAGDNVLHAFSGSLPPGPYSRVDLIDRCGIPDLRLHVGDVCDARMIFGGRSAFALVLADPPYSPSDCERYSTPPVNRRRALAALADVTEPFGHLVWLDTCWPIHSKRQWVTVGRIAYTRSTNHRTRDITIFERQGTPE